MHVVEVVAHERDGDGDGRHLRWCGLVCTLVNVAEAHTMQKHAEFTSIGIWTSLLPSKSMQEIDCKAWCDWEKTESPHAMQNFMISENFGKRQKAIAPTLSSVSPKHSRFSAKSMAISEGLKTACCVLRGAISETTERVHAVQKSRDLPADGGVADDQAVGAID